MRVICLGRFVGVAAFIVGPAYQSKGWPRKPSTFPRPNEIELTLRPGESWLVYTLRSIHVVWEHVVDPSAAEGMSRVAMGAPSVFERPQPIPKRSLC